MWLHIFDFSKYCLKSNILKNVFLAQLYSDLKQFKESKDMYIELLNRNPENHAYYKGLENAMQAGMYIYFSYHNVVLNINYLILYINTQMIYKLVCYS